MIKINTDLHEVYILEPQVFKDDRGWFMESWSQNESASIGINGSFVQDNHSFTAKKGTLRGLHFQNNPMSQSKIIRCIAGSILDVAVDIRKGSPHYLKWVAVELTANNRRQLYIPRGFAHGYLTLCNNVEVIYKVDNFYKKEYDRSIIYNDTTIGVEWGISNPILSAKDSDAPCLAESDCNYIYNKNENI